MGEKTLSKGIITFGLMWFGQLISLIGSGLTGFTLGVWAYQQNQSATQFALIFFFSAVPGLVIAPLAGALVDRWDRRRVILFNDIISGGSTICLAALFFMGQLEVWHIYLAMGVNSLCNAFRWPAFTAITPLIVPKQHLGRTGGMIQFAESASQLLSPALAGVLYVTIDVYGVLLIDAITFIFSVVMLLLVRIPKPETSAAGAAGKGSLLREALYGWTFLTSQPSLRALLIFMIVTRFVIATVNIAATPLALTFASVQTLGLLRSIGGVGALVGSAIMSVWGGSKRRVHTLLIAELLGGLCLIAGGLSRSVLLYGLVIFLYFVRFPISTVSSYTIWISKIPPDVQGRVFAVLRVVTFSALPLATLVAGPVIDRGLEPLFADGGQLTDTIVGQMIGVGPGRGIGFLFTLLGLLSIGIAVVGFLSPNLQNVENTLPEAQPATQQARQDQTEEDQAFEQHTFAPVAEGGDTAIK